MGNLLKWLQEGGPDDVKHQKWLHPFISGMITMTILTLHIYYLSEYVMDVYNLPRNIDDFFAYKVSFFLLAYDLFLIGARCIFMGPIAMYDLMWFCNIIMFINALGLYLRNPIMIAATINMIYMDQWMWFLDIVWFILFRKWPVGVAKYLGWKQTPLLKKLTSTHHLWFIPLCLWAIKDTGLLTVTLLVGISYTFPLLFLSKFLSPMSINLNKKIQRRMNTTEKNFYLNLNLSWGCWKDLRQMEFLLYYNSKRPPPSSLFGKIYSIMEMNLWWVLLNVMLFFPTQFVVTYFFY